MIVKKIPDRFFLVICLYVVHSFVFVSCNILVTHVEFLCKSISLIFTEISFKNEHTPSYFINERIISMHVTSSYGYGTLSLLTNSYKWYTRFKPKKKKQQQQPLCSQFVWILKSSLSEVYQNPTSIKSWGPRCLKVNLRTNRSIHICFFHFRKQIKPQNKSLLKKKW